ncbi:MAG: hypothetical protein Kow00102_03070 [Spirochaetota bacterium]|nr:hypothetical protein [Spirochaetota bacterium]
MYTAHYQVGISGIVIDFDADDILTLLQEKMQVELPANAEDTIRKWTGKAYELGLGRVWSDEKWKVEDTNALDFFARHDQHFFGKQFEHYSGLLRKVVEDELKGKRAYSKEVVTRVKKALGEAFEHPTIKDYYDLCIRNAVNKSRNYGRIFQYERLGIATVEIVAILDNKTSAICREMNGRRIEVKMLADHVRDVLQTPMDELKEKFAWPTAEQIRSFEGLSTQEILEKISCKLPPYHGRCRTTTVITKDIVVKKNGGNVEGIISQPAGKEHKKARERKLQVTKLTQQELLAKVEQQRTNAYWDTDNSGKRLRQHEEKHKEEFSQYPLGYEEIAKKVLKNFDRVFTFIEGTRIKWAFYSNEYTGLVIIEERTGKILTMYNIADMEKYLQEYGWYVEIL